MGRMISLSDVEYEIQVSNQTTFAASCDIGAVG